jgi:4-aminobutyrate aminotransferase-like enzyme
MNRDTSSESLLQRRFRVLGRHSPLFYDNPLHLVRGDGAWVYDSGGRRYLDAYNNVPHVGHSHPRVVEALTRQAATLNTHTRYLDETIVTYAERLTSLFDPSLSNVAFCCTGSEANELALRMVRSHTGAQGFVATDCGYHGNTDAVIRLSGLFTPPDQRGPFVRTVPAMDPYRDRLGRTEEELADAYAHDVAQAIDSLRSAGVRFAGLILCTGFVSEGMPTVPSTYLAKVIDIVHAAGGLFIADEVQAGFGRSGTHFWGYQRLGGVPDVVTLGKPMGNGHPIAGVVTRPEILEGFASRHMYFNTFGGNPVSAATGLAVLDALRDERLLENATQVGEHLRAGLRALGERYTGIGDVRGNGLLCGVDLVRDREGKMPAPDDCRRVVNQMRERGVLLSRAGPRDNVLKIRPPMVFTASNADLLLETLEDVLKDRTP